MKLIFLFTSLLFVISSSAEQVCQDLPEFIKYKVTSNNFDGSVYYEEPRVFVNGKDLAISSANNTVYGFCAVIGKKYLNAKSTTSVAGQEVVYLTSSGDFNNVVPSPQGNEYPIVQWIVCK